MVTGVHFSSVQGGIYALHPVSWKFQGRSSSASPVYAFLLQAVDGVTPLALCSRVVSQGPQQSRSSGGSDGVSLDIGSIPRHPSHLPNCDGVLCVQKYWSPLLRTENVSSFTSGVGQTTSLQLRMLCLLTRIFSF